MNAVKLISTVVYIMFIGLTLVMVGNINQYFDMPALVVVVVIAILYALAAKGDNTYIQKFGDGAVRAGWLGSIIGIIAIFGSSSFADSDMQGVGSALAVCSLTVLYGYFFKLGTILLD